MTSVLKRERRYPRPPELEQFELRYALMQRYRASDNYRTLVAKGIRPLWRKLNEAHWRTVDPWETRAAMIAFDASFDQHKDALRPDAREEAEAYGARHYPQELRAYLATLEKIIVKRLHLAHDAQPAAWAASFVQADVTAGPAGPVGPAGSYTSALSHFTLKIEASATGADLRQVRQTQVVDWQRHINLREEVVARRHVAPAVWGGFDEWEAVREAAYALIDAWIAETRNKWLSPGSSFRYQNPSTVARQGELLDLLYHHLAEGTPVDHSKQRSVRRLAKTLELDFPRTTR